jgi:hypothetical protein
MIKINNDIIIHKNERWCEDSKNVYLESNVFDSDVYVETHNFGHAIKIPKKGREVKTVNPVIGLCENFKLNPFEVLTFISMNDKIVGVTFWDKKNQPEALKTPSKKLSD